MTWPAHLPRPARFPPAIPDEATERPFKRVHHADRRFIRAVTRMERERMGLEPKDALR